MHAHALLVGVLGIFNATAQISVPLVVQEVEPGVQRIAVYLKIGDSSPQLVLLDTGSDPLLFGSNVSLPSSTVSLGQNGVASYGITSSEQFPFATYRDAVSFTNANGHTLATAPNLSFGRATSGNPGDPFQAIMGAGPSIASFADTNGGPNFSLYSILAGVDYPAGTLPGFTIALLRNGSGGTLTIGIDPAKWAGVTMKYPMTPKSADQLNFPNFPSYDGDQLTLVASVSSGSASPVTFNSGSPMLVKIDSGDPTVSIVLDSTDYGSLGAAYLEHPSDPDSSLLAGTVISLDGPDTGFDLLISTLTESPLSGNAEIVDPPASYIHVNTGIQPYNDYAITYVFDDGTGQGWVGFEPLEDSQPEVFVKRQWSTRQRSLRIHGTATPETTGVLYRAKGDRKWSTARGIANWSFRARLDPGRNILQVRALGGDSSSSPVRVTVRRR